MPEEPAAGPRRPSDRSLSLVQREVALIVVLCIVAIVLFAVTRTLAEWTRDTNEATAISFFDRGQRLLAAGATEEGVAALRKAAAADRSNVEFTLALARALSDVGDEEESWQILHRLREDNPEDAEINYLLARLARARQDPEQAVLYYNHALYGSTPAGEPIERRHVQLELAELLIDLNDVESASAILGTLAREQPDDAVSHLELARLYQRARDWPQALDQFEGALASEADNPAAILGAADAALALNDFPVAARYYDRAVEVGAERADLPRLQALVHLVVDHDPLASRLSMTTRVARLQTGLQWADERLEGCPPPADDAAGTALREELTAFREQPREDLRDTDVLAAGIDLVARVEGDVRRRCDGTDPMGEAWTIIQRAHSVNR